MGITGVVRPLKALLLLGPELDANYHGTLRNTRQSAAAAPVEPIGETDSEQAFCELLVEHEANLRTRDWRKVHEWLIVANDAGALNCLLSDGETLLAYRDKNGARALQMVERRAPFPLVKLADEDFEIDLDEVKSRDDYGWVFATRPLTKGETWKPLDSGELVVVRAGVIEERLTR